MDDYYRYRKQVWEELANTAYPNVVWVVQEPTMEDVLTVNATIRLNGQVVSVQGEFGYEVLDTAGYYPCMTVLLDELTDYIRELLVGRLELGYLPHTEFPVRQRRLYHEIVKRLGK